ncbi:MAG: carboxyltransferase domain-containing protein, partial [Agrococcus casei]
MLTASDTALLVEAADLDESMRLLPALVAAELPGVTEFVPAARTIMVRFSPGVVSAERLESMLLAIEPTDARTGSTGEVTVPVRYDGEDLGETARLLGLTSDELIARHQAATWTVAFSGF